MASSVTVKVTGLRELGEALRRLSTKAQRKACRAATNAAAQVVKKRAIKNAPMSDEPHVLADTEEGKVTIVPGTLRKAILVARVRKTSLTSEHLVTVGGKKKHHYAGRYAHLVEFGTIKYSPRPFLRPGFEQGKSEAVDAMKRKLHKELIKEAKRD